MRTEGVSADDAAGAGALAAGGFTFATIGDTAYMSVPEKDASFSARKPTVWIQLKHCFRHRTSPVK